MRSNTKEGISAGRHLPAVNQMAEQRHLYTQIKIAPITMDFVDDLTKNLCMKILCHGLGYFHSHGMY